MTALAWWAVGPGLRVGPFGKREEAAATPGAESVVGLPLRIPLSPWRFDRARQIAEMTAARRLPPTMAELAAAWGCCHANVFLELQVMETAGLVAPRRGRSRAIVIVAPGTSQEGPEAHGARARAAEAAPPGPAVPGADARGLGARSAAGQPSAGEARDDAGNGDPGRDPLAGRRGPPIR